MGSGTACMGVSERGGPSEFNRIGVQATTCKDSFKFVKMRYHPIRVNLYLKSFLNSNALSKRSVDTAEYLFLRKDSLGA